MECSGCGKDVGEYVEVYGWTNTHGPVDGDGEQTGPFYYCRDCFHEGRKQFSDYRKAEVDQRFEERKEVD